MPIFELVPGSVKFPDEAMVPTETAPAVSVPVVEMELPDKVPEVVIDGTASEFAVMTPVEVMLPDEMLPAVSKPVLVTVAADNDPVEVKLPVILTFPPVA